jgi:hypothetical protein
VSQLSRSQQQPDFRFTQRLAKCFSWEALRTRPYALLVRLNQYARVSLHSGSPESSSQSSPQTASCVTSVISPWKLPYIGRVLSDSTMSSISKHSAQMALDAIVEPFPSCENRDELREDPTCTISQQILNYEMWRLHNLKLDTGAKPRINIELPCKRALNGLCISERIICPGCQRSKQKRKAHQQSA